MVCVGGAFSVNFALLSAAMRAVFSFFTFFFPLSADFTASFRLTLTARSCSLAFFVAALAKVVAALDLAIFPSMISQGSLDGSFDGSNDGKLEGLFLGESLGSTDVKVLGSDEFTKLGLSDCGFFLNN